MDQALRGLGVREETLTRAQKTTLNQMGFLRLPGILSPEQVDRFRARLDELADAEGHEAGKEVHQEDGTARLADLVNKDPMFEVCFTDPRVLAAIGRVLDFEFRLSSLNSRAALPGHGHQAFHADWSSSRTEDWEAVRAGRYFVCNSIWLLVDFTAENGATRVVPGSHRSGALPQDVMDDPNATHPDEIVLTGRAGDVVVFNSHLWHAGGRNDSDRPRPAMHGYFCKRDRPQQTDQRSAIRDETRDRVSPEARYILDV
jgi:ectoine hydroxylase-related dioxygenase (phytanoyl-CoA dioxygenase family)